MMHPDTELRYIDDQIGYGVFATAFIPKGTIVWALDPLDQILEEEQVRQMIAPMKKQVEKYSYRNQHGQYVLCWDLGRYINHSFHANCIGTAYDLELAARDIFPGEQVTDDYGTLNVDAPFYCLPEPHASRQIVMPDDLLTFYREWDELAHEACKRFADVPQPLAPLVKPEFLEKMKQVAAGTARLDSVKIMYYDRKKGRSR
ncbi:SET domain-containing protein [Aneurinibacillus sp. BA2021]|nr:SET domain-containing protein [Aneurinibacillus sp. BA2021]